MLNDLLQAAGGRKFLFAVTSFWFLCGLLVIDKLPPAEFADIMQWLITGYLASTALQAGAGIVSEKIGSRK